MKTRYLLRYLLAALFLTAWCSNAGCGAGGNAPADAGVGAGSYAPAQAPAQDHPATGFGGPIAPQGGTITSVTGTSGVTGSCAAGPCSLSADTTFVQKRVTGTCASGLAIGTVNADGTVSCNIAGVSGTGTTGDLSAWASSTSLGNYAGSTATACGAGNATTNISIGANGALTNTCSSLTTLGAAAGTGATNTLPKWSNTTGGLTNSSLSDDGTTLSSPDTDTKVGLDTGTGAKVFNVGRDVGLTTNAQNGWAVTAYTDGNVYIDSKTWTSGSTKFRVGQGAAAGATTTWLTVTNSNGATSFAGAATMQTTLAVNGNTTLGASNTNTTTINGRATLNADPSGYAEIATGSTADTIIDIANSSTSGRQYLFDSQSGGALALIDGTASASRWQIDASGVMTHFRPDQASDGLYAGTVQDFADEMNVGHVRKNVSLNSDALGTDVVNPNVGWYHSNYTSGSTLAYTTSTQTSPRGVTETVGQITCTNGTTACTSGGSDLRMLDTSTSTGVSDLRSTTWTLSVWVKATSGTNANFTLMLGRYNDNEFSSTTCAVNSTTWTRCAFTKTFSATSYTDNSEIRAYVSPQSTTAHYVYGAQLEQHSGATPYQRNDAVLDSGATSATLALAASMGRFGLYEQDPDVAIRMFDAGANYYGVLAKAPATGISVCREDGTCTTSAASTAVYGKTLGTGATAIYGDATAGGAAGYFAGDVTITSGHTLHVPTVTNDTGSVLTIGTTEQISITTSSNFTSGITVNETGFGNATFEATGGGNTIIAGGGTGATQISSGSGGIALSSNTTISGSATLTTSSGLTTIGAGGLTSTAGANTFGESEYSMTTASNSSGTLTDASFARTARGVWWTWTGGGTLDGFGFTSGVPIDGQKFTICVIGGGSLTLNSENASETTAGRRFNFITSSLVIRSGACRDLTYDGSVGGTSRWRVDNYLTPQVTMTANAIPKMGAGAEVLASSLTDNGTTVATSEAITGGVITGTKLVGTGASGANTVQGSFVSTAQTQNVGAGIFQNTGSFDTTAAGHTAYGIQVTTSATVSAGANTLVDQAGFFSATGTTGVANYGIEVTASGGSISNVALLTDNGDVLLANSSGATTIGAGGGTITLGIVASSLNVNASSLSVANGTTATHWVYKDGTNRPTVANCGTTPTVVGDDTSGFFTTTATPTNTCALTFNTAFGSNVDCRVWGQVGSSGADTSVASYTVATTGITAITGAGGAALASGIKVHWICNDH